MKLILRLALLSAITVLPLRAQPVSPGEHFGTVAFATSCVPAQQASFNRGVALLHDFWYEEAKRQFTSIVKADPSCSMAYWGEAMSDFQQIWEHTDAATLVKGSQTLKSAPPAKTERERAYIAALLVYYEPDKRSYQQRIDDYSAAMAKLYAAYPDDIDAGAFYALSVLATSRPDDTTLSANRKAMTVLTPLFAKAPDNPGVDHYIIHACDTPALAQEGLLAAKHYGAIASSAPHAVHMPGHIFARLGMWQDDIVVDEASVSAGEHAEMHHASSAFDQLHAEDFLLYAYLQAGEDAKAKAILTRSANVMTRIGHMNAAEMASSPMMSLLSPYFGVEMPMIYDLELHDWNALLTLALPPNTPPWIATGVYWAHVIAAGRMHQSDEAQKALADLNTQMELVRKSSPGEADSVGTQIRLSEADAWAAYAAGKNDHAIERMREAAKLQDKVGQGEVDIPAREMLADMLLELHQPQAALVEYKQALVLSPNRFNGLYHAGMAAEAAGDKPAAAGFYAELLKQTDHGAHSSRPELAHAKSVAASVQVAAR